jgi:glycine cleavage system H protein
MPDIPDSLRYTPEHEWFLLEGDIGVVGITDYAQGELGDIVFVELPAVGDSLEQGKPFGTVEAVKTVEDLYAPVNGEVVAVNEALAEDAAQINSDPYGEGWMVKIRLSDPQALPEMMSAEAYVKLIEDQA